MTLLQRCGGGSRTAPTLIMDDVDRAWEPGLLVLSRGGSHARPEPLGFARDLRLRRRAAVPLYPMNVKKITKIRCINWYNIVRFVIIET